MFENLGEKMTNIGNTVKEGASNVIDNTKKGMNNLSETITQRKKIEDAKSEIKSMYLLIGEKFYCEHKDSAPAGYEEDIARINSANSAIAEAEEEIRKISGVKYCPQCGTKCKMEFVFCTSCGYKFEMPAPQAEEEAPAEEAPAEE